jgi:hypothetical protein
LLPFRTRQTPLTDDDLVILDVVCLYSVLPTMLRKATFNATWAFGYCHSLDNSSLTFALNRLRQTRSIESKRTSGDIRLAATQYGGELWTSERSPDWLRYVQIRFSTGPGGREQVTAISPGDDTPDMCVDFLAAGGLGVDDREPVRAIGDSGMLDWITFPVLYFARATVLYDSGSIWDHSTYESRRPFWTNVTQLQKFIDKRSRL